MRTVPGIFIFFLFLVKGLSMDARAGEVPKTLSIGAVNSPEKKDKALAFLQKSHSAVKNYLFSLDDKYKLIEVVDPNWQGALPDTIVVEPGGKIVYARQSLIDPLTMRRTIVEHPMMGRFY